jgi:hypothetical protein
MQKPGTGLQRLLLLPLLLEAQVLGHGALCHQQQGSHGHRSRC